MSGNIACRFGNPFPNSGYVGGLLQHLDFMRRPSVHSSQQCFLLLLFLKKLYFWVESGLEWDEVPGEFKTGSREQSIK